MEKISEKAEPIIAGQAIAQSPEKSVEAGLGRRRCITFACGKKPSSTQVPVEAPKEKAQPEQKPVETPKRKCAITFACPSRPAGQTATTTPTQLKIKTSRNISPAPSKSMRPLPSPKPIVKPHRGSDSTVKNESPKSLRKIPSALMRRRKYSDDNNDVPAEERRFHEFAPTQSEQAEQWLEESGCYRNRLTVNDTLFKENVIRRIGEEVEEEALEDEEFDEDDLEDDEEEEDVDYDEEDDDDENDVEEGASDEDISDAGFQTDDEEGFAVSDSENDDDSDNEWWTAGRSTAATSTEHLDHLRISPRRRSTSQSSMESGSGDNATSRPPQGMTRRKTKAMKIHRSATPDLPDSTDFVCGTLDEDRPLEQAYITALEQRKAAKHKARPQDIDPTFPTSDPEMDEEDDDSEDDHRDVEESDHPGFLHGKLDLNNNDDSDRRGRHATIAGNKKKSPSPPHQRLRSPPPAKRVIHRSPPPPPAKRNARSPAPVKRVGLKSPPPPVKRITHKSPPPPAKRSTHKSPPPARRLFSQSPQRMRSPPPFRRIHSPPPSRRTSQEGTPGISFTPRATLAQRPQPTHTASLPRVASTTKLGRNNLNLSPAEHDDLLTTTTARGAIDIVKGLEKKRQRRTEKLYQKHCNRAGKDREHKKPKPGKGAERMREVGLELAAYKGKREHMLSY